MTRIDRRRLLLVLAAAGAAPGLAAAAPAGPLAHVNRAGARALGRAWLAANSGHDAASLAADLFPQGLDHRSVAALRARVAADFRAGRLFVHRGWRLSDAEGRVLALLALG